MATTPTQIRSWLERGQEQEATHVIIVVSTWDCEDYPVYIAKDEDVEERLDDIRHGQNRAIEVYNLSDAFEPQLNQHRAWNI